MENGNGWHELKQLVLFRLSTLEKRVEDINDKFEEHNCDWRAFQEKMINEMAGIKVKSRLVWSVGSGLAASIVTLVGAYLAS